LKRQRLYDEFGNTRLGRQELHGDVLEDITGALWAADLIEQHRVTSAEVPKLVRVRTYVDPSWGTTNDECGIIVAGLGVNRHAYILSDLSKRTTPSEWGIIAALGWLPENDIETRREAQATEWYGRTSERVVGEKNFQGEQVRLVMKGTSTELDRRIPFNLVSSSQGKRLRAEPVLLQYENGKVHHVGRLTGLEFQMLNWVPPKPNDRGDARDEGDPEPAPEGEDEETASDWSPDRLDAMVFAVTDLLLTPNSGTGTIEVADGRIPRAPVAPGQAGANRLGPKIGNIPIATRQGQLAAAQMKGRRPENGTR
jgi:phage terminase large subunit-like protein